MWGEISNRVIRWIGIGNLFSASSRYQYITLSYASVGYNCKMEGHLPNQSKINNSLGLKGVINWQSILGLGSQSTRIKLDCLQSEQPTQIEYVGLYALSCKYWPNHQDGHGI